MTIEEIKRNLATEYGQFTKEEILEIMYFFRMPSCIRSHRKDQLLKDLADFLVNEPLGWLSRLPERDAKMMDKLTEQKAGYILELGSLEYYSISEAFDLTTTFSGLAEGRGVSLNPLLYDLVKQNIKEAILENEANGRYEAERLLLGFLNLYGIIPEEKFKDLVIESLLDTPEDMDLILRIFQNGLADIFRFVNTEGCFFFSPCILDVDRIAAYKKEINYRKNNYQLFSKEQAYAAGLGSPYCNFNLETSEGRNLLNILTSLNYSTGEIESILHEIWLNSQYATSDENAENLFSCLNDKQDEIGGFQFYKECVDAVVSYANSLPKWALNGFSSEEANQLKISIKVVEGAPNEGQDFFLGSEEKAGVQSASGLSEFFK